MSQVWNVGYILRQQANMIPNNKAIIFEDEPVTFKELNERTNQVAHYLMSTGVKKGDRIGIYLQNCHEFIYLFFAAAKIGLIVVPLNLRLVGRELEYQLNNSGSRMLFFHANFFDNVSKIKDSIQVDKDKYIWLPGRDTDAPPCPDWAVRFHDFFDKFPTTEPALEEQVFMDDPLGIIYTSGVTGAPKGAVVSHSQSYFKILSLYLSAAHGIVFLSQLPLFHSGGLFISLLQCIGRGMTMILREKFDPVQFCNDIEKYKANIVFALTTMWRLVLDSEQLDKVDRSSVIMSIGGGERTPKAMLDKLKEKGIKVGVGYGQTENSAMTHLTYEELQLKPASVGKPREWSDMWIEDPNGNRLPPGEIGEIVAVGPKVMSGYWNMPEATAKAIVNGVLHTGDLGYMDAEGYFYIADRAKDMYRSGGENVYPAEIEKVLYDFPRIKHIAIIGIADDKWGETGKAFIESVDGKPISKEEILEFLKDKVSKYKYPSHVEMVDEMPMTATGKIMKVSLKQKHGVRLDKVD
ncbi:Long-chain-fatty-acid--CoA ligase [Smithella sp. ME-1]|uniref:Long-chain-fatty-acid--coa ligase n=1 Tax=hydrocarbon metagenome TaxID=938273 RepID=A0A0W8FSU8_9ZZZZ|nr:Long-chain-fatty-acid--CoA ligase [Smithella sp. ME-1]